MLQLYQESSTDHQKYFQIQVRQVPTLIVRNSSKRKIAQLQQYTSSATQLLRALKPTTESWSTCFNRTVYRLKNIQMVVSVSENIEDDRKGCQNTEIKGRLP